MEKLPEIFGSLVFNDKVMRERLPKEVYETLLRTVEGGEQLDLSLANVVANAMMDWAVEKGATHYTHWFQPMTGITAEKHDSFVSPISGGQIRLEFSGKELVRGEPDASSFPSGGLRASFEARGYTAWDPTSYAFIKEGVLCIPTAFWSYGGEALDMKTPLLKSMEALNVQALRILRLFGNFSVKRVVPTVGAEQEYFLLDKSLYKQRKDLIYTGRTLLGADPPKGQELDDHYFGAVKPRVAAFMDELDEELWKRGVPAKTKHNETAPGQHELAPVFATANVATDHNQLIMEMMKKIASKHDLVCLLHEKPFKGVNGSGKHNNWALTTDTGVNLLDPGSSPHENAQFLLFFCAVIQAVDEYQDLLRISVASAANDQRLGGYEAPPAVISMYIGSDLMEVLEALENKADYDSPEAGTMEIGVSVLPALPKDSTDRNRTSPFAFTGNRFEFRMPGSNASVAFPNIVLNTVVAEALRRLADRLEAADDFNYMLNHLIRKVMREHKRIIFNGNGYCKDWEDEARRRGLLNLPTTPDALPYLLAQKNVELFTQHRVFTQAELISRCGILQENYCKLIRIEANTLLEMVKRDVIPATVKFMKNLGEALALKNQLNGEFAEDLERRLLEQTSKESARLLKKTDALERSLGQSMPQDLTEATLFCRDRVLRAMEELRGVADKLETLVGSEYWPYPSCGDLLYSVQD